MDKGWVLNEPHQTQRIQRVQSNSLTSNFTKALH
jgi:hypothetical protein